MGKMRAVVAAVFVAVAAAHGPAFTESLATCSGVHTLHVGMLNGAKPVPSAKYANAGQIETQIGESSELQWGNLAEKFFGCSDGRARSKLVTTPGGDFGEFVRAVTVLSAKAGKSYTLEDVKTRLTDFLTHNPNKRFAMCTDQKAMGALIEATGVADVDFDITKPPASFAATKAPLDFLTQAKFQGDPTVAAMLKEPKSMFVSEE